MFLRFSLCGILFWSVAVSTVKCQCSQEAAFFHAYDGPMSQIRCSGSEPRVVGSSWRSFPVWWRPVNQCQNAEEKHWLVVRNSECDWLVECDIFCRHCCCCCYLAIVLIVFLSFIVLYSEMWHIIGCWHCMATVISACRHLLTDMWHCHAWCGCCHCWWWCCQHLDWHRRLQTHGLSQPGVSQKIINVLSRCNFAHILATL